MTTTTEAVAMPAPAEPEVAPSAPGLSAREQKELERLESIVRKHIHSFIEAGGALWEIHEKRLYRQKGTFADYCQKVFHLSPSWCYRLIKAWEVQESNVTRASHDLTPENIADSAPLSARAAVALAQAPSEQRPEIVRAAVENNGEASAPAIKDEIAKRNHRKATPRFEPLLAGGPPTNHSLPARAMAGTHESNGKHKPKAARKSKPAKPSRDNSKTPEACLSAYDRWQDSQVARWRKEFGKAWGAHGPKVFDILRDVRLWWEANLAKQT